MRYYSEYFSNFPSLKQPRLLLSPATSPASPSLPDFQQEYDESQQFSSFMYWKPQLPDVDVDVMAALLEADRPQQQTQMTDQLSRSSIDGVVASPCDRKSEELSEYSQFNYWKAPVSAADELLAEMLRCLRM